MEFRVLRYFLAVAREESISRAAEFLHVTQPNLSRQMQNLEDEVGQSLLIRGKRKIGLTDAGSLLRKRAEEILELYEKTETELLSPQDEICGDVCIGGGESYAMQLIARTIKEIQAEHPKVKFHLFSGDTCDVTERLDKGLIDFGLLFTEIDPQKYEALPMPVKDTWGVLMRKDFPLAKKEAICPEDLWDKPLIISHQKGDDILLDHWLRREKSELHIVATYNLLFNASLLVDEGLGYALGLDNIINTQSGNLCFRPLSPRLEVNSFIVWKKYQVFSKAANLFLRYLQDMIPLIEPLDPNIQGSGSSR